MLAPSLTAHAILRLLLSNFRPNEGIGKACNQSDAFLVETAKSLALSLSEVAEARSHFVFRRQPADFFFSERICQMKAGQNNKNDGTNT